MGHGVISVTCKIVGWSVEGESLWDVIMTISMVKNGEWKWWERRLSLVVSRNLSPFPGNSLTIFIGPHHSQSSLQYHFYTFFFNSLPFFHLVYLLFIYLFISYSHIIFSLSKKLWKEKKKTVQVNFFTQSLPYMQNR